MIRWVKRGTAAEDDAISIIHEHSKIAVSIAAQFRCYCSGIGARLLLEDGNLLEVRLSGDLVKFRAQE